MFRKADFFNSHMTNLPMRSLRIIAVSWSEGRAAADTRVAECTSGSNRYLYGREISPSLDIEKRQVIREDINRLSARDGRLSRV